MMSLIDLFLASRSVHEDRPALWVDARTLTYAELHHKAAQLASAIHRARGFASPEQFQCGLLVSRTPTAYAGVLASLIAGGAYVPLNPRFPSNRLHDMLAASAVDTLIVDHRSMPAAARLLQNFPRRLNVLLPDALAPRAWSEFTHRCIDKSEIEGAPLIAPMPERSRDHGAYLLFTSGSTGAPKGVLISHGNAMAYIASVAERYRPGPEDRFSQLFDFSFDLSVHDMFLAWAAGACLYCAPEGGLLGVGEFIRRCGLTFWFSVPSTAAFMRQMRMLKPGSYPTLRWSLFCGEALPMGLALAWQDAAPNSIVENLYGPTEATIAFTAYRVPKEPTTELRALHTVPIGMPLPDQQILIIDDEGNALPDGETGELCLGGSQVAAGYWGASEQTMERFRAPRPAEAAGTNWYRTGDMALMNTEYGLIFRGRMDRQVKIRGYRVELQDVEHAMRLAAETDTVAAIPTPVGDHGLAMSLVGFVAGSQKSATEIMEACRASLPDYMAPSGIHHVAKWPLNANGKTDYKNLTALLQKLDV